MAKIAYVGLPAHGHTNPSLPVVKALIDKNHHVLYYNAESFRQKVAPTGVDFRPLAEPMPTERELAEALHEFINASLMLSGMSRHLTYFLLNEFEREKPELVIYDSAAMWGYIAARSKGIANVCFITTFVLDGSQRAIGLGTIARYIWSALPHAYTLLRWRRNMAREFGSENSGGITEYADLNIVFTSKAFHPRNNFIDERFKFVGPAIDSTTREGTFAFDSLPIGVKIYISLGTINHLDLEFYRAVFDAFADYPAHFILSVGKQTDLLTLGLIPDNFLVHHYVPQLDILQVVGGFITHGGMNSVHEGLYFGVPEIVVPHQFEQLLNGKRVAEVGAGLLIGDKRPYGKVTPPQLRQALDSILQQPHYRQNAQKIGQTLKEAGGYRAAVAEIEAFLKNH